MKGEVMQRERIGETAAWLGNEVASLNVNLEQFVERLEKLAAGAAPAAGCDMRAAETMTQQTAVRPGPAGWRTDPPDTPGLWLELKREHPLGRPALYLAQWNHDGAGVLLQRQRPGKLPGCWHELKWPPSARILWLRLPDLSVAEWDKERVAP